MLQRKSISPINIREQQIIKINEASFKAFIMQSCVVKWKHWSRMTLEVVPIRERRMWLIAGKFMSSKTTLMVLQLGISSHGTKGYSKCWPLYQFNASNAVLEVRMEQPPVFVAQWELVCKLKKLLSGVKNSFTNMVFPLFGVHSICFYDRKQTTLFPINIFSMGESVGSICRSSCHDRASQETD